MRTEEKADVELKCMKMQREAGECQKTTAVPVSKNRLCYLFCYTQKCAQKFVTKCRKREKSLKKGHPKNFAEVVSGGGEFFLYFLIFIIIIFYFCFEKKKQQTNKKKQQKSFFFILI